MNKYKADAYFIGTSGSTKKITDWADRLSKFVDAGKIMVPYVQELESYQNYIQLCVDTLGDKDSIESFNDLEWIDEIMDQVFVPFKSIKQ